MGVGDRGRRWAGWLCLGLVAMFVLLGYYFGNVRFTPLAGGFLILSAVFLIERGEEQVERHGIHPGTEPPIGRPSGCRALAAPDPPSRSRLPCQSPHPGRGRPPGSGAAQLDGVGR